MVKSGTAYERLVASVIGAFDPHAHVEQGKWVEGPDGRRDMDVSVKGTVDGRNFSILIECKDFDPTKTGRAGIRYVDAIDSKRQDLNVDLAVICSNSGFTKNAIRKAKRKKIGLISALKSGDSQIKIVIKEEIYTRIVKISDIDIMFRGNPPSKADIEEIKFEGVEVRNWVFNRIAQLAFANPVKSETFRATHDFKLPVEIEFHGTRHLISGIDFNFHVETEWLSQVLTIDASLGMYDYVRGRIRLAHHAPGGVSYIIKDYNPYEGTQIDFIPDKKELGVSLLPGEVDFDFMVIEMDIPENEETPKLDELIVPEDLNLKA